MNENDIRPMQGFILGTICGLILWSAAGLAYIYYSASEATMRAADQDRYSWTCNTDTECEAEAARRGLPLDRD